MAFPPTKCGACGAEPLNRQLAIVSDPFLSPRSRVVPPEPVEDQWPFDQPFMGVAEVAAAFGVTAQTLCNWQTRQPPWFPKPLVRLKMGPIYSTPEIRRAVKYLRRVLTS
jgi:hypothetical protein